MTIDGKVFKEAGIDYEEGLDRFRGKEELYERLLKLFLLDENYSGLEKAMQQRDYENILKSAHTLKGAAGNLSLNSLYRSCAKMVDNIRAQKFDTIEEIYEEVKNDYNNTCKAITTLKN